MKLKLMPLELARREQNDFSQVWKTRPQCEGVQRRGWWDKKLDAATARRISKLPMRKAGKQANKGSSTIKANNQSSRASNKVQSPPPMATTVRWMPDGSIQVFPSQQSTVIGPSQTSMSQIPRLKFNQVQSRYKEVQQQPSKSVDKGKNKASASQPTFKQKKRRVRGEALAGN